MNYFNILLVSILLSCSSDKSAESPQEKAKRFPILSASSPKSGNLNSDKIVFSGACTQTKSIKVSIPELSEEFSIQCINGAFNFTYPLPMEANGQDLNIQLYSENTDGFYETNIEITPNFDAIAKLKTVKANFDFTDIEDMRSDRDCLKKVKQSSTKILCYEKDNIRFVAKNAESAPVFDGEALYFKNSTLISENITQGLKSFELIMIVDSEFLDHDRGFIDVGDDKDDNHFTLRYDKKGHSTGCLECIKAAITTTEGETAIESGAYLQMKRKVAIGLSWTTDKRLKLYVDGKLSTKSRPLAGSLYAKKNKLFLGRAAKGHWNGKIYKFVLLKQELTSAQRAAIYSQIL